ncbi:MAG: hypothetical protein ABIW76_16425 [Fibrobacteria bacterium]
MKRILSLVSMLAVFAALGSFNACVTDSKSNDGSDTAVTEALRKPRAPKVTYSVYDSLVLITIIGSKAGEESSYWIRRDGNLLEQPAHQNGPGGDDVYVLRDTLSVKGSHTYTVQYGISEKNLSDKSPEFVLDFSGHSRSGIVRCALTTEQLVRLSVSAPSDEALGVFIVERKVGGAGSIQVLDTVSFDSQAGGGFVDTSLVAEDAWLYYRVRALDLVTEEFLPPSPWDSILVKNKVWKYIPLPGFMINENGVHVSLANPLAYPDNGSAYYYLYRGAKADRSAGSKVDSLPITSLSLNASLNDQPDSGEYFYWVDARDPWGRISPRSTPKPVLFTGRPQGPAVFILRMEQGTVVLQPAQDPMAETYILQRSLDTARGVQSIDTMVISPMYRVLETFVDHPTTDGFYYYRVITIRVDGLPSDPGPWARTAYFHYEPFYTLIYIPVVNRGDHVTAKMDRLPDYYHVLYRARTATGLDTLAVDTLRYSDGDSELKDTPPVGTWYYRVVRKAANENGGSGLYRSQTTRIEFTGKKVGPTIVGLVVGTSYIDISITFEPEALACIFERSQDGKAWTAFDTVSVLNLGNLRDRPPADGFWYYRARSVSVDMSVSEPGAAMRTYTTYTYTGQYLTSLNAYVENKGTRLEFPFYPEYGYVLYLFRSDKPDWKEGNRVDTLNYMDAETLLRDTPPKGVYYYWVEREPVASNANTLIHRSRPIKVDFTGTPAITALQAYLKGIEITLPYIAAEDTLEIHRSTGKPEDLKSFERIATLPGSPVWFTYLDTTMGTASGFYHYRIAVRSKGGLSDLSAVKSIYFEPNTKIGNFILFKESAD